MHRDDETNAGNDLNGRQVHCQCLGIEQCFAPGRVTNELERYRSRGPNKSTRLLVEALQAQLQAQGGLGDETLLDIGGGVGAVIHALLQAGIGRATDVDASTVYLAAAREEAARQEVADRIDFRHGDFAALSPTLPDADVVTLDRVICCYDDMAALVSRSAAHARRFYGVVYPRDTWWIRLFIGAQNTFMRVRRAPMRFFVHPTSAVEAIIHAEGLERRVRQTTGPWQVVVYARATAAVATPSVASAANT